MQGKRIKWGNIIIFLLIVAAGISAFYFKDSMGKGKTQSTGNTAKTAGDRQDTEKNDNTAAASQEKTAQATDAFVMGIDSWIGATPVLIALNREYNRDYYLDLKVKYITNDRDRITALRDGEIQATEMTLPAFLKFQKEYPDSGLIVGITDFSRGADGIIAKAGIKTLNDMEGKKVSFVSDGIGKFILNKFLRLTGLRYQDIEPVERKEMGEVIDDLKSGNADLIVSWSPDMNLAIKEINSGKPNSVKMLISTKEAPDLVPTVLVVNKKAAEKNPDRVEAFLKTWYVSAKYIIERPDKAYEKLAALMSENKDIYGNIGIGDVKDSFANIRLMSLDSNFVYFGIKEKEKKLNSIINDTIKTWQKYGDMPDGSVSQDILADLYLKKISTGNNEEILVGADDTGVTAAATQTSGDKKKFVKQDEKSIDKNTEKVAKVDIPPVYYDTGKAAVKAESMAVLNEVINVLNQFPEYYLTVDAHTDSVGSEQSNLKLSKDRAETVRNYLVSKGVDANRIVARGWGKYRLLVANEKTEADRAKNRRTEFILSRNVAAK